MPSLTMKDDFTDPERQRLKEERRAHRRRRFRRHGRIAYIRSVYSLPSLATLGNVVCGFASMYVAALNPNVTGTGDPLTKWLAGWHFAAAAYLIFLAMLFDAIDGRLARFTRHTTDFGGQLDSLADVISFGAAPAFLALHLFRQNVIETNTDLPVYLSRLIWAIAAIYVSCAAMRLARFNVSNEHGEQHHYSFLGLPSPGAGGTVAAYVLMQLALDLRWNKQDYPPIDHLAHLCAWFLPVVVLATGLLMVSNIRYPHVVNKYLRGKHSIGWVLLLLSLGLAVLTAHRYLLAVGTLLYVLWAPAAMLYSRFRPRVANAATAGKA